MNVEFFKPFAKHIRNYLCKFSNEIQFYDNFPSLKLNFSFYSMCETRPTK